MSVKNIITDICDMRQWCTSQKIDQSGCLERDYPWHHRWWRQLMTSDFKYDIRQWRTTSLTCQSYYDTSVMMCVNDVCRDGLANQIWQIHATNDARRTWRRNLRDVPRNIGVTDLATSVTPTVLSKPIIFHKQNALMTYAVCHVEINVTFAEHSWHNFVK